MTETHIPRIVLAALKGGAGKTFLSTGITAALHRRGFPLAVFKKGPDYIDAGWLGLAAGEDCHNLDTYLMGPDVVTESFRRRSAGKQLAVVEGNRGLFDGVNAEGTYSTAELAKLLGAPVILVVDATKMTRTAAALVRGCQVMDPDVPLRGVILNRVAGERHEKILRQCIEETTGIPVIGSVHKLAVTNFPQRHLGLLPLQEHPLAQRFIEEVAELAERSVDLDALVRIARGAGTLSTHGLVNVAAFRAGNRHDGLRIGIVKDSAFQFYYPENLEAIAGAKGTLTEISALETRELPDLDALYIGGGFPETHAEQLAGNTVFKTSLLKAVEKGLPVYAECGGLMYLARSLCVDDKVYPMVGVFPLDTVLERKPKGLGYIHVHVELPNPFYPQGAALSGHEFHYSSVANLEGIQDSCVFRVLRGHGMDGLHDGISRFNALGTYMHVHALGESLWAKGILARAAAYHSERKGQPGP
jgi:cobyrinic acid a,c-diamide synthase